MTDPVRPVAPRDVIERFKEQIRLGAMGYAERFEAVSERFYRETGFLAPGKSVPVEMWNTAQEERRTAAWEAFQQRERETFYADLQFAIDHLAAAPVPCAAPHPEFPQFASCVHCGWISAKEICPNCDRERDSGIKPPRATPPAADVEFVDPSSERGQQMIRNAAFMHPTTQGDPPPTGERDVLDDTRRDAAVADSDGRQTTIEAPPLAVSLDPHRLQDLKELLAARKWREATYLLLDELARLRGEATVRVESVSNTSSDTK